MTALMQTTSLTPFDGFEYDDGENRSGANYGKFDAAAANHWHDRDGALKHLEPWLVANLFPENLKWKDKRVVERILPQDGDRFVHVDDLNAKIPKSEWEEDFNGNAKGPWVRNYTIHLVNPETGATLVVSNSTVGQRIAYQNLKERTQFMRRYRGENVVPIVKLGEAQMRTSFGVKLRPDFEITDWQTFGPPTAPSIEAPVAPAPRVVEAPKVPDPTIGKVKHGKVSKLAAAEILNDEIPF